MKTKIKIRSGIIFLAFLILFSFGFFLQVKADACDGADDGAGCSIQQGSTFIEGKCKSNKCVASSTSGAVSSTTNNGFPVSSYTPQNVEASQCDTGETSGAQTGCSHSNDADIIAQCKHQFPGGNCSSVSSYLNELQSVCNSSGGATNESGNAINCSTITQNGYYGREASDMALWIESNQGSGAGSLVDSGPSGAGSLVQGKCTAGYTEIKGVCFPSQTGLPSADIKTIITNILYWLLGIFGVIAIIAFAISGFQYLMSAGNEGMIETAKRNMVWSIVGVVVALSGLVIIRAVDTALRGVSMF
jgi:hypothetical protein